MLQALRNKIHGWPAVLVIGIAVIAMSIFGIEGYFTSQSDTYVAKVGKREISQQDYQARTNELRQRASAQQGDKFDPSVFELPETKQHIVDAMINEQLLLEANDDLGMRVSDQAVRDYIAAIPSFQVNGQFDPSMYRTLLQTQGKTPAGFESEVRASLSQQLLPDAISGSALATDADMDRFLNLQLQRRDVRYFVLPRSAVTDSKVADADIDAYYKSHQADFMNPEQVSVKYLEVNGADLKPDAAPSEDDLKKRYEQEKQRFVQPEQRLVSHILINVPKNATPEQQKDALAKAEKVAGEANADNFSKLAQQDSDDLGSKRQGGDLGWLEKGVANPAFDSALFSMQKGQISKPVLSDEGYHVLWLRDTRSGQAKPYAEVRDQLVKEVSGNGIDRKYNEVAGQLTDKTYQNPASLEPAAQDLQLPIKTTPLFGRNGGEGITTNAKLLKAAFSDDVLAQGNNSGLIELGPNHAVIIHVDKHVPAAVRPLAEVHDAIRQKILDERAVATGQQHSDELLQRLRKGEDMQAVAGTLSVQSFKEIDRTQPPKGLPDAVRTQAFLAPHPVDNKPQFASVALGDGSFAVMAVDKVQGADLAKVAPEQRDELRREMLQFYGGEATSGFINALKAKADIKLAKDRW